MKRSSWWKLIGLAGAVGVTATGVAIARAERRRRAYTPQEIHDRLRTRYAEAAEATPPAAE
jgi:predicted ATPase